ncbi:MAG TPA: DinB family protein [Saprospiraceae bacterium]|nr:DinB family protein [Saprospiraceae bacterium]
MKKQVILNLLTENHSAFIDFIDDLTFDEFLVSNRGKWTPGQQLDHILLSVRPVRMVISLPKILLKFLWGKANRKSRTYDELVKKYQYKLEMGGRASGRFIPKKVTFEKKHYVIKKLKKEIVTLRTKLERFSEDELDYYVIPHPLLGKLTAREMLYFTIYHVEHHNKLTERDLKNN